MEAASPFHSSKTKQEARRRKAATEGFLGLIQGLRISEGELDSASQNLASILKDILPGLREGGMQPNQDFFLEISREKAISMAVEMAHAGDVILVAGKGHENYQIIGKEKIHYDDRECLRKILSLDYSANVL